METDNSFEALINPGEAENFFDIAGLPDFEPGRTTTYSHTNALWLSEFCRLIYRQEKDEIPGRSNSFRTRDQFLSARGWEQSPSDFFNCDSTQAAIFLKKDHNCAVLVFRGTLGLQDTLIDGEFIPVEWEGRGLVHEGFKDQLDAVWEALRKRLATIPIPVFFTGHSLGAALATLACARSIQEPATTDPAALYTYGSPRAGDATFGAVFGELFHCRVVNNHDVVPTLPPKLPVFHHVGQMHRIDDRGRLQVYPLGADPVEMPDLLVGAADFLDSANVLFKDVVENKKIPPQRLADHIPANYTARLEKANLVVNHAGVGGATIQNQ